MANSALKQLLKRIETSIIKRVDAEKSAKDLIKNNMVGEIADLIQQNQRLKGIQSDWLRNMKYTLACKRIIAKHKLIEELTDATERL